MKKHFSDLFKYNEWANERILLCLEENSVSDDKILQLYSHTITAQIIWLLRIRGLPTSPFPIWEQYKLSELKTMTEESSFNWAEYIKGHQFDTFEEMISYKNSNGTTYETTIREIINHVLNHSTYHRGQIALKLRELNIVPPATDYIVYHRIK